MLNANRHLNHECYTFAMKIEKFGTAADIKELLKIRDEFGALIDSHAGTPLTPKADLIDLGDSFQLQLEVPGVGLEDLELAADENELQVAGIREAALDVLDGGNVIFSERPVGAFQRTFALPHPVRVDGITAHLASGVLVVLLPKMA